MEAIRFLAHIRIVLLIANGGWLPLFVLGNAHRMYLFSTTIPHYFANVWLPTAIGVVTGSLILAGSIAYIWRFRPHADNGKGARASQIMKAIRIALLIGNGFMLLAQVTGGPYRVFLVAKREGVEWPFDATAWAVLLREAISVVVCIFILVGNIAYIWRERPHAHNEKGASDRSPAPFGHC